MTIFNKIIKAPERLLSKVIPHQHAADRRAAQELAAQQIDMYKTQKEALTKATSEMEMQKKMDRERANKSQISNLQHAYRKPGFMDVANGEATEKLGG